MPPVPRAWRVHNKGGLILFISHRLLFHFQNVCAARTGTSRQLVPLTFDTIGKLCPPLNWTDHRRSLTCDVAHRLDMIYASIFAMDAVNAHTIRQDGTARAVHWHPHRRPTVFVAAMKLLSPMLDGARPKCRTVIIRRRRALPRGKCFLNHYILWGLIVRRHGMIFLIISDRSRIFSTTEPNH